MANDWARSLVSASCKRSGSGPPPHSLAGGAIAFASFGGFSSTLGIAVSVLLVFVAFIGLVLVSITLNFAPLYVVAGFQERRGIGAALMNAGRRSLSFIWYTLMSMLVIVGGVVFLVGLPFGMLAGIAWFALGPSAFSVLFLLGALAALALIGVLFYFLVRFMFGVWLVADGHARGIGALVASRELTRGHFPPLLGRFLGLGLIFFLLMLPAFFIMFAGAAFGGSALVVGRVLEGLYIGLFLIPIGLGAQYVLYANLQTMAGTPASHGRGKYILFAILGAVCVPLLFAGPLLLLTSLNAASVKARNAGVASDMRSIQLGAALYYDAHASSYGTAASCAEGMFAGDTIIAPTLASIRSRQLVPLCRSNGAAYVVYVPASSGGWCVDSAAGNGSLIPSVPTGFSCSESVASSTLGQ